MVTMTLCLCANLCVCFMRICLLCACVLVVLKGLDAAANAGAVPAVYGEAAGLCKAGAEMERKRGKKERKEGEKRRREKEGKR